MTSDPLAPLLDLSGIADAVDRSRSAVDRVLANRVLRRRGPDVSAESLRRGAWASAVLDGSASTLADLGTGGGVVDDILAGALRVSGELAPLAEIYPRAQRQALARLHALAAAGRIDDEALGRPRPDREVAHRLDVLADVLSRSSVPAVVVAAVVQAEIVSLDAFPPVSGVVARAAARLTLIERGLDPRSVIVFEVGHLELRAEFDAALADYASGGETGLARWLVHCCTAVEYGARETTAICEAILRG